MAKNILAAKLGVSLGTLKNWEFGRTHLNLKSWTTIRALFRTQEWIRTLQRSPLG